MSKRQVKRVLGKPDGRMSARQYLRGSSSVRVIGRLGNDDHWVYFNTPAGHHTQIVFRGRYVSEVMTVPAQPTS